MEELEILIETIFSNYNRKDLPYAYLRVENIMNKVYEKRQRELKEGD